MRKRVNPSASAHRTSFVSPAELAQIARPEVLDVLRADK
jgi:hypothetical protein